MERLKSRGEAEYRVVEYTRRPDSRRIPRAVHAASVPVSVCVYRRVKARKDAAR